MHDTAAEAGMMANETGLRRKLEMAGSRFVIHLDSHRIRWLQKG